MFKKHPDSEDKSKKPEKDLEEQQQDAEKQPETPVEEPEEEQKQEVKEADYHDLFLRSQAEFDNFRKRVAKERQDLIKYAEEGLIYELLTVVDDFNRGLLSAEKSKDFDLLLKGVQMVQKHLMSILNQKGLQKIECVGKPFDPATQEALQEIETDEYEEATVVEELQTGYTLNGRVVRTAKVAIAKKNTQMGTD